MVENRTRNLLSQNAWFVQRCTRKDSGLTLIEVLIALMLLAGAFTVLLGLQSSVLGRTFDDSRRLQAMLISRQILSAIESSAEPLENMNTSGSLRDILEEVGTLDPEDEERLKTLDAYQARLQVRDVEIPQIEGNLMKHLLLSISWSELPRDSFEVDYFFPSQVADEADGDDFSGEES